MKGIKLIILTSTALMLCNYISAQALSHPAKLRKEYYYLNNCIAYPSDVMLALYRVFDNKDFANERSKMSVPQANLFLWNAIANVTTDTKLNSQLRRYAAYDYEIVNLYKQLGYDDNTLSCIQTMFVQIKENENYEAEGCAIFSESDSLIVNYVNKNLDQLVTDENGKALDKKYTGEITYYDYHDFEYVKLNMFNGSKRTSEHYGDELDLHRVNWYYPSGTLRYMAGFTETGKKINETWFYPVSQVTKTEIAYHENGNIQSDVEYDEEGHVIHEEYYTHDKKKIMSFSNVTLADGTIVYAPIEAYNENGVSTLKNGTGYLDIYSYAKAEKQLLAHQVYKDYLLDGTTTEIDPYTGKTDYEYSKGVLISTSSYYNSGGIKKQSFYKDEEVVNVKTYPKYKNFDISITESENALNQYVIVNTNSYEEKTIEEKLVCTNCIEVLKNIFNKEWAQNNPDIFDKDVMQFSISIQINNEGVITDTNIYDAYDLYSREAIAFEDSVKQKLFSLKYEKLPKLNSDEMIQLNNSFNIKIEPK